MVRSSFTERTITSQPKAGKVVKVETPTHLAGEILFESGAIAHLTTTFDVYPGPLPNMIIYGSEGTLVVPDPNNFSGQIQITNSVRGELEDRPLTHGFAENSRGLGVLDMAIAAKEGRTDNRASGELALHALEIMKAFEKSSNEGRHVTLATTAERPRAMSSDEFADQIG
jgi:predicted dehydrogenase